MSRFVKKMAKMSPQMRDHMLRERNKYILPTMPTSRYIPREDRKIAMEDVGITVGDFVYITEGKFKGIVSKVIAHSPVLGTFKTGDATRPMIVPKDFWSESQQSHLIEFPEEIPEEHVKLASRDRDEQGNIIHIVADEVICKDRYYDQWHKRWLPRRFVKHHENIEIPWPMPENDHTDSGRSTREDVAHLKTYEMQTIAKSLLPPGVIHELRNRYSKYKRNTLTDIEARRLNEPTMPLTTEQKIYLAKKAKEPKKKLEPLGEEVKDYIGKRMADHLSKIDNPYLLAHLDALSKVQIPDFKKTMEKIEEDQHSKPQ